MLLILLFLHSFYTTQSPFQGLTQCLSPLQVVIPSHIKHKDLLCLQESNNIWLLPHHFGIYVFSMLNRCPSQSRWLPYRKQDNSVLSLTNQSDLLYFYCITVCQIITQYNASQSVSQSVNQPVMLTHFSLTSEYNREKNYSFWLIRRCKLNPRQMKILLILSSHHTFIRFLIVYFSANANNSYFSFAFISFNFPTPINNVESKKKK